MATIAVTSPSGDLQTTQDQKLQTRGSLRGLRGRECSFA